VRNQESDTIQGNKETVGFPESVDTKAPKSTERKAQGQLLGLVNFKRKEKGKPSRVPFEEVIRAYAPRDITGNPDAGSVSNGIAVTRVVEEIINAINCENLNHSWKTRKDNGVYFQPNVELAQNAYQAAIPGHAALHARDYWWPEHLQRRTASNEDRRQQRRGTGLLCINSEAGLPQTKD
jgi:hypothetical protein